MTSLNWGPLPLEEVPVKFDLWTGKLEMMEIIEKPRSQRSPGLIFHGKSRAYVRFSNTLSSQAVKLSSAGGSTKSLGRLLQ